LTESTSTMPSPKAESPKAESPTSSPNGAAITPVQAPSHPIEADEADLDEDDGGYTTDQLSSSSTSLASSIRAHTFEDGIRYHKFHDGKYAFPNDENEQNRDDMKHAMTLLLCADRLHFAPIGEHPQNIIDLG